MINRERFFLLVLNLAIAGLIVWLIYTGIRDKSPVYRDAIPEHARGINDTP